MIWLQVKYYKIWNWPLYVERTYRETQINVSFPQISIFAVSLPQTDWNDVAKLSGWHQSGKNILGVFKNENENEKIWKTFWFQIYFFIHELNIIHCITDTK